MILISAGHHKHAKGAQFRHPDGIVFEFDLTTAWVDYISRILDMRCVVVPSGTLRDKVEFINDFVDKNSNEKSIAAEIHFNSAVILKRAEEKGVISENDEVNGEWVHVGEGSETLYYPGSKMGKEAATIMQSALSQVFPPNRGAKEGWYQMNKAKGADFFLAKTNCVSLIIEPEFIDNVNTISKNMDTACHVIASALLDIERDLNNV